MAIDKEKIEDTAMEESLSALKYMFREPSPQNKEGKLIKFF